MAGNRTWRVQILLGVLVCLVSSARADQSEVVTDPLPRHDRPPRKVIVGTTMTRWYSNYPGIDGRIEQMRGLIDQLAAESRAKYGRSIDLALFSEYALTAGKQGTAAEIAVLLDDKIIDAFAAKAREHNTYIVFGGVFFDKPGSSSCSNAAVVIDRQGRLVGRYDKVHPVLDRAGPEGQIVLPRPKTVASSGRTIRTPPSAKWPGPWICWRPPPNSRLAPARRRTAFAAAPRAEDRQKFGNKSASAEGLTYRNSWQLPRRHDGASSCRTRGGRQNGLCPNV